MQRDQRAGDVDGGVRRIREKMPCPEARPAFLGLDRPYSHPPIITDSADTSGFTKITESDDHTTWVHEAP
ncbi:hypothetical protein GCM10023195_72190 [Actinoallomurus liliacearum]|uniref:Uncharacterized protein n=1 Tax=Actinoallomurus liliacearum TaxID=1080073 RepID=A0ABP8TTP9_9ACTN